MYGYIIVLCWLDSYIANRRTRKDTVKCLRKRKCLHLHRQDSMAIQCIYNIIYHNRHYHHRRRHYHYRISDRMIVTTTTTTIWTFIILYRCRNEDTRDRRLLRRRRSNGIWRAGAKQSACASIRRFVKKAFDPDQPPPYKSSSSSLPSSSYIIYIISTPNIPIRIII